MFNMNNIFEQALGVSNPWYIKDIKFTEIEKRLDIYLDFKRGSTFEYNGKNYKAYDTKEKSWKHLNFFEHEAYLHARVPRIKVDDKKVKLVKAPWEGIKNGFTLLLEAFILKLAQHMPVNIISKMFKISNYKIWSLLEKYIYNSLKLNNYKGLTAIGLDETSFRKGHDYITLFVDLIEKRTIFITDGKDSSTIEKFVEDLKKHNGDPDDIEKVSCDMSPAFIKGARENLPNAEVTFDKFHIIKVINKAVDEVRKEEAKDNDSLKKTKYLFLKNAKNLTVKQQKKLEKLRLSKQNLKSLKALDIRESFQNIYQATTEEEFEKLLNEWYYWATHSQLDPIKKAAKTIKKHWEGIVNWKKNQINNGILEGLNSVIQAAKRKARGYSTKKNFKIIAYLTTGKFDFKKINKEYLPT